ncbi:uncharacterized protein LOC136075451 isoform X2 [Hydra vulgaris]|uniref:Uncharacterized protein LOC136075451 isoform X2 n=1 Tax=Hydra vulgaris TaxID=6087 RepID=A0ABM4B7E1_HYDVU
MRFFHLAISLSLFTSVTPGFVSLSSPVVQLDNFFIYLKWNSIPSETCPVTYNIEFLNKTNQIVNQFYGIITTSFSTTNEAKATIFRLYAVCNGIPGPALNLTIPPPQSTTTTTTTTAVKTTILCSKPANVLTIVGLAVGVATIFDGLLVASYFLGYYRHKMLSNKVKKEVNKDNGYQELLMPISTMGYQKPDAVHTVNENNTSLPNIDYKNIAVSESSYNYVDPKLS